jgi:phosphoesterase RecJ-like protein
VCDRSADKAFEEVAARLAGAERLVIITHARPDGDALGATAALAGAARAAGKHAEVVLPDGVPQRYAFLFAAGRPAAAEAFAELADRADLVAVVDTCAFVQLGDLAEAVRRRRDKIVVIDHHATRDDVGAVQWVDPTAAAAGVMVAELTGALGWPMDAAVAEALLAALGSDTGWFRFSNADGRCLRAAAGLVDAGVRPDELYRRLYESDRPERMQLLRRVLASLELHQDGRIAAMVLRRADFDETGARRDETENLVNEAMRLGCVEVAILVVEEADCVRASLRSRGGVDVAAVAHSFGGGGHTRAAGLRQADDVAALKERLIRTCADALGRQR